MKNVLSLNSHKYNYNKATRWLVRDSYYFKYNYELFQKIIINKRQETLNTTLSSMSKELNKFNQIRDDFGRLINKKQRVKYVVYGNREEKVKNPIAKIEPNPDIMFQKKKEEISVSDDKDDFSSKLFEMSYASKYLNLSRVILTDFKPKCSFHIHDKELTLKSLLIRVNCMRKKEKYFEKDIIKHLINNENNFFEIIKNAQIDVSNERTKFDFNINEYLDKIKKFSSIEEKIPDQAQLDIDMLIFEDMKFDSQTDVKIEPSEMLSVVADRIYSKSIIVNNYIINKMYPFLKNQDYFINRKKAFYTTLQSFDPKININMKELKKNLLKRIIDKDDLRYSKTNPINETILIKDFKNFDFYYEMAIETIENNNKTTNVITNINKEYLNKDALKSSFEEIKQEVNKNQEEIHIIHLENYKNIDNSKKDPVVYHVVTTRLFSLEKEITVRLIKKLFEMDVAVRFNLGYNTSLIDKLFINFDLLRRASRLPENVHDRCHFGIVYINGYAILTNYTRPYYGLVEHNPLCVNASRVYNLNLNSEGSSFYNKEDVIEFVRILHILNYSEPREIEELKHIQSNL
jgi:hypothetical protein